MKNDLNNDREPVWMSLAEIWERHKKDIFELWEREDNLKENFEKAENYFQQLKAIKDYYKASESKILDSFRRCKVGWYASYPLDWSKIFTPIESLAWSAIRCKGRIVLYPQYPVLNYQLDFANPGLKIGLELDGKAYHNKERDFIRDAELSREGWTIYRITGSEMNYYSFKTWSDFDYNTTDEEKIECLRDWLLHSGDGVIEAIKQIHFEDLTGNFYMDEDDDVRNPVYDEYYWLLQETLELHKS